jgi:hypothetical protein
MATYSPAAKEKLAKDNGFPSYDAMLLFEQNRSRRVGASTTPAPVKAAPVAKPAASGFSNVLKMISDGLQGKTPPKKR